jgi:hypothetical protein
MPSTSQLTSEDSTRDADLIATPEIRRWWQLDRVVALAPLEVMSAWRCCCSSLVPKGDIASV